MKNWGKKLSYCLGATLCSALMATQSVQTVWADDNASDSGALSGTTSASTNVTVTFTQARLFIDRMPNFDFGNDNSLISAASSGVSLKNAGKANQRSLIISSRDAAVGFSVSVQCGKGYLYDPDSDSNVGTSELTSPSAEQKPIGTLTLNSKSLTAGKILYESDKDILSNWNQYKGTEATAGGNIPLYIGDHNSSTSNGTNVFSVTSGFHGESGVNFNNAKSATFQITDTGKLDKLKNYFSTSPSTSGPTTKYQHLNLIFPLQWTVAITPETSS